mgnify:CR=1 FL=1
MSDLLKAHKADTGKPRWGLLPTDAVREIVRVLTFGAEKYTRREVMEARQAADIVAALLQGARVKSFDRFQDIDGPVCVIVVQNDCGPDFVCCEGRGVDWAAALNHLLAVWLAYPGLKGAVPLKAFKIESHNSDQDGFQEVALTVTGDRNWEAGFDWSRPYDALQRHLTAWWEGEDLDPESGLSHLAHCGCCLLFLLAFQLRRTGRDDRSKGVTR